jgi:hypothetical protein
LWQLLDTLPDITLVEIEKEGAVFFAAPFIF